MTESLFTSWSLLILVAVFSVLAAGLRVPTPSERLRRFAEGWGLPATLGVVSAITVCWMWGGLDPVPYIHDESSYLLQGALFTRFEFAAPAPPLPEFFEQFHVFTTPVLASRYLPGWGLALAPGIALGLPGLVPIILTGLTAALLVVLVRRIGGPAAALLAWVLWIGAPIETRFRASYLSEHLTTFLWLGGWWALWRWRDDRRTRWLVAVAIASAGIGITRPLTAIAYAIPVGIVVLVDVVRERRWRQLAVAAAAGAALCTLVPLQNRAVTGDWRTLPMELYSRIYTPYDLPGFGLDTRRPLVPETPDRREFGREVRIGYAQHVVERIPELMAERGDQLLWQSGGAWGSAGFRILLLIGLVAAGDAMAFAGLGLATLFLAYLWYAHPAEWTVYYLEGHPVIAAAVALGLLRIARGMQRWLPHDGAPPAELTDRRVGLVTLLMAAWTFTSVPLGVVTSHVAHRRVAAPIALLHTIERLVPRPSILFIRYAPTHNMNRGLIENHPDLAATPVWSVLDLGAHNADLIRLAPGRMPLLYDEASGSVYRLAPDGVTIIPPGPRSD